MFLRKLSDEETEQIRKSKDAANVVIKAQRKELALLIKSNRNSGRAHNADLLTKQLDASNLITGSPVIVKAEEMTIVLNYDLLKKFDHLLYKSDLRWTWIRIEGNTLTLRYGKHDQSGAIELFGLPTHQIYLLTGLPTIDLKE